MARPSKASSGGLPRKEPDTDQTAELGIAHDHGTGDAHHTHRMGNITHDHDDQGRPVFEGVADDGLPLPVEGPGTDQLGTVDGVYHPAPDPAPGTSHADYFNGEADRKAAEHRRAEIAAAVTERDVADMEHLRKTHPDIKRNGASGAPGESIADVLANDVQNTISFGETDPMLAKERVWRELATTTVLRIATFNAPPPNGPGTVAPAEVLLALRDQVEHLVSNRGLNGGGS